MRRTLADIEGRWAPPVRGVAIIMLSLVSFIVALWVLMTIVRVLVPAA